MSSKEDDTLPLPGFSQEPSNDATVDEDFIPASQPQSSGSLKVPITNLSKPTKEIECAVPESKIDDTLPITDRFSVDSDKSSDFIPETETKKTKLNYATEDFSCKKKLSVFDPEDIFKVKSDPIKWDSDISKILESPALDTQNFSLLNDLPAERPSCAQEAVKKCDEFITEIIVNDSAETVDLETTPAKIETSATGRAEEKLKISCSLNSDGEKNEDTQIFDNSSVLLLEQPDTGSLVLEKSKSSGTTAEKLYLQQTIDDNEVNSQDDLKGFNMRCNSTLPVTEMSEKFGVTEAIMDVSRANEICLREEKDGLNPNSGEPSLGSIAIRKVDFKLTVSCIVFFNTKAKKVVKKIISKVYETPKSKPKCNYIEHASDNASDKSKRYSTSSSGSVYSDQANLPFALPKRVSAISDMTDSSEDDFGLIPKEERRALGRMPWKNEYLLPLKLDDIIEVSIDKEELLKRPVISSPRKPKRNNCDGINLLKEILESSSSEQTSFSNLGNGESPHPINASKFEEILEKETSKNSETLLPNEVVKPDDKLKEIVQSEGDANKTMSESLGSENKMERETLAEPDNHSAQPTFARETKTVGEQTGVEEEGISIRLREGLPVFARWSDKRYYPGVLSGNVRSDRWDVKFDDGTLKIVRKDFIMPSEWLKLGALVFALIDDRYESGQIVDVKMGERLNYFVELDVAKKVVAVQMSDLCLTDVMAGIIREKYKPMVGTPKRMADIDFDNVLSGKRLREQRTPSRPPATVLSESSGTKKKALSKTKKIVSSGVESVKDPGQTGVPKSENDNLMEGKILAAESQSRKAAGETPLRGTPNERKGKVKPRSLSLSLAFQESYSKRKISKNWVAPDGTPIPGPSGVKMKKPKSSAKTRGEIPVVKDSKTAAVVARMIKKNVGRSKTLQPTVKSKRKRKLDESDEDNIKKKSLKGDNQIKTRTKKRGF